MKNLVQALVEAAPRFPLPPPYHTYRKVRYLIDLDAQGKLLVPTLFDTATEDAPNGVTLTTPTIHRTNEIKPYLLCDTIEKVIGLAKKEGREDRAGASRLAFTEVIRQCWQATQEPALQAILTFLEGDEIHDLILPESPSTKLSIAEFYMTFRVDGEISMFNPTIQAWWAEINSPRAKGWAVMQCLVCGTLDHCVQRTLIPIMGLPGATTGAMLASANFPAAASWGLENSLTSPMCGPCAERASQMMTFFANHPDHHVTLDDTTVIWWAVGPNNLNFHLAMSRPKADDVQRLFTQVIEGTTAAPLDNTQFCMAIIKTTQSRLVIQAWRYGTLSQMTATIQRWWNIQQIVGPDGEPQLPYGLTQIIAAFAYRNPQKKDLKPSYPNYLVTEVLRAFLDGRPLAWSYLDLLLHEVMTDRAVAPRDAALIKAILASNKPQYTEELVSLAETNTAPGYVCGRLFSILASVQEAIAGKSSIPNDYWGGASTRPATVFPILLTTAQAHFAQLLASPQRESAGRALQTRLTQVLDLLDGMHGYPKHLNTEQQGLFSLGYYHQNAANYRDRAAALIARRERAAQQGIALPADDEAPLFPNDN